MRAVRLALLVGAIAVVALATWRDLTLHAAGERHALALALVGLVLGASTWLITRRAEIVLVATAAYALWPLPHAVDERILLVALGPAAVALVPEAAWRTLDRGGSALVLGIAAGWIGFVYAGGSVGALLGAATAVALAVARPKASTRDALSFLRAAALFLPFGVLATLFAVNAATGAIEASSAARSVVWGLGLAALAWACALAGLGLVTLLESSSPFRQGAWYAFSFAAAVVIAGLATRDPRVALALTAAAAIPLWLLAAVASARLATSFRPALVVRALPLLFALAQAPVI